MAATKKTVTYRQRLLALFRVAKIIYSVAPSILYVRLFSIVLDSTLPIVTTYFAAQTTTELALAYSGQAGASQRAIMFVLLTALSGIIMAAWSAARSYSDRMASYKLNAVVTDKLMMKFLSLDFWRYDNKETADLFDRSREFARSFSYLFDTIGTIFSALAVLVASFVALSFVSLWLALLLAVAVVPGFIIQYKLSKARTQHWQKNIGTRRKAFSIEWQLTAIDGIAEIRLYGLVNYLVQLWRQYRDKDEKQQVRIEQKFIGKELLSNIIESVAEVAALVYTTVQITAHALPVGQFLFVQQNVSRGLQAMRSAISITQIDESLANLSAFDEFLAMKPLHVGTVKLLHAPESIEVNDVSFSYPQNNRLVLSNVSLHIKKGERVAIVGENGAGKTTLIKLFLGIYAPTRGDILIDGISTTALDLETWHKWVGVMQQTSIKYTYAVARENVTIGDVSRPFSKERYEKALKEAEADEFIQKLPHGDQTYITQWMGEEAEGSGVDLSGGQRQRLALARNFYRDSPVVILDEPTSAIDALAESHIFKHLFDKKDKTIIVVSHRLSTVRRADRVIVLADGAIVEQGAPAELLAKKGAYYTLFESQL